MMTDFDNDGLGELLSLLQAQGELNGTAEDRGERNHRAGAEAEHQLSPEPSAAAATAAAPAVAASSSSSSIPPVHLSSLTPPRPPPTRSRPDRALSFTRVPYLADRTEPGRLATFSDRHFTPMSPQMDVQLPMDGLGQRGTRSMRTSPPVGSNRRGSAPSEVRLRPHRAESVRERGPPQPMLAHSIGDGGGVPLSESVGGLPVLDEDVGMPPSRPARSSKRSRGRSTAAAGTGATQRKRGGPAGAGVDMPPPLDVMAEAEMAGDYPHLEEAEEEEQGMEQEAEQMEIPPEFTWPPLPPPPPLVPPPQPSAKKAGKKKRRQRRRDEDDEEYDPAAVDYPGGAAAAAAGGGEDGGMSSPTGTHKKQRKRHLTGFIVFCAERRKANRSGFEGMTQKQVMQSLSGQWKAFTDQQRQAYKDKAEEIKQTKGLDDAPQTKRKKPRVKREPVDPDSIWGIVRANRSPPRQHRKPPPDMSAADTMLLDEGMSGGQDDDNGMKSLLGLLDGGTSTALARPSSAAAAAPRFHAAPQVRIGEDGELVIDEETREIGAGRHMGVEEECVLYEGGVAYEVQQGSVQPFDKAYKNTKAHRWTQEATDRFYEALRTFGSDLMLVKSMFPEVSEKQIKDKFKVEERRAPDKIEEALKRDRGELTRAPYEEMHGAIVPLDEQKRQKDRHARSLEFLLDGEEEADERPHEQGLRAEKTEEQEPPHEQDEHAGLLQSLLDG
ncbi:unnamed protein product [Vitrella brassicaformis CCMP3155]|uniref:HMG box domain-containing protein n=2 Tax=Vitrella brassicaformis TaxID=1169539 RepID=A0A0G4G9Z7_VITBC|nr:unnamed protein product [Vitrella brassicaformis CCMP3155]|eukprot:CEM25356.1 unnamed protein product [Vitrella brassicaformis CCMP3155]